MNRRMLLGYVILGIAFISLAFTWFMFDLLYDAGEFKTVAPHFSGACRRISPAPGAEDITIHPETGIAFISSDDRRARMRGEPSQGAIYVYDLNHPSPTLTNLTIDFEQDFHPHGISLYIDESGVEKLFVVNHRAAGDCIEIFDYSEDKLIHRESLRDALMTSPNDIVAVGPRSFYVTNDHGNVSALGRTLEEYLRLARSYVLYYDARQFQIVAQNIAYANGINVSRDGRQVFVAACIGGKIKIYDRDLDSGALTWRSDIDLDTGVDNIEVDANGDLWVAAHPQLLAFTRHARDAKNLSPSQVLKISLQENPPKIDEIFLDHGHMISGSSVAAVFGNRLLIGSVFEEHFLVCEMQ